jgi:hypothetical protein
MRTAWREIVDQMARRAKRGDPWWTMFGVLGQGQRG